jgi:hypothetical protein
VPIYPLDCDAGFGSDLYEDHADLGNCVALLSTQRVIFLDEQGAVREVLPLTDVLFVEPVERTPADGAPVPRALIVSGKLTITAPNSHQRLSSQKSMC